MRKDSIRISHKLPLFLREGEATHNMDHPATRLLALLELLQAHTCVSGIELAAQLGVDVRTVRHYVQLLLEMDIPVESVRGRHGGYRLMPGFKLPPMMFTAEEALALMLGLKIAERIGATTTVSAAAGARSKLERVLPTAVRNRVESTLEVLAIEVKSPHALPRSGVLLQLSTAIQEEQHVHLHHRSWREEQTERTIAPYGVVNYQGRWFVAGYCYLRREVRVFRMDRILSVEILPARFTRPASFDSVACVIHSLATAPGAWAVQLWMKTSLEEAQQHIPPALGLLEAVSDGVILRCWVQRLEWFAHFVTGLEWECVIRQPAELREAMRSLAAHAISIAERT